VSPVRLALDQLVLEQKRFWRNPASAIFTVAFPIFFLVIFGSLNANDRLKQLGNINFNQFFTPNIVAFGLMSACLVNLGINLPFRRDTGLLKRMRGTPLPIPSFVFGLLANAFLVSAILTVVVMTFGAVVYNVVFPLSHLPDLVLVLVVGAASFSALGIAIASLVPNADAGPAIVNAIFFPLVFLSGTFFPVGPGSVLAKIGSFFPVRPFLQAIFATFDPLEVGSRLHWGNLAVVAAWGVVASIVAVRRFRWEPRVT
jgi:ABC-2 type transport system permease protein